MSRAITLSAMLVGLLTFGGVGAICLGQELPSPPKTGPRIDPANYDRLRTGDSDEDRIVVPTNQVLSPAGRQVAFSDRPTDVALSPNGRWLAVLERGHVAIIDPDRGEMVSRLVHASGSVAGIVFAPNGTRLFASNTRGSIGVFDLDDDGKLTAQTPIRLPVAATARGENVANSPTGPQSPARQEVPPGA